MLTASPSPRLNPSPHHDSPTSTFLSPSPRSQRSQVQAGNGRSASPIVKPHSAHVYGTNPESRYCSTFATNTTRSPAASSQPRNTTPTRGSSQCSLTEHSPRYHQPQSSSPSRYRSRSTQTSPPPTTSHRSSHIQMVDEQTQYSPPQQTHLPQPQSSLSIPTPTPTPSSHIARLQINDSENSQAQPRRPKTPASTITTTTKRPYDPVADAVMSAAPSGMTSATFTATQEQAEARSKTETKPTAALTSSHSKRNLSIVESQSEEPENRTTQDGDTDTSTSSRPQSHSHSHTDTTAPSKRPRPEEPAIRLMPSEYSTCDTRDLVLLISSMLMELIRYNDDIPLRDGHLTRFHSRAPPGISVTDYLQRLTTHATLSPPILLSMVYYIDKLCALYPAFTISSLTVHRFLITSATVASKGLSDSFWTNKTYARVGGVSVKELALLELEFLVRVQWRIVPQPEVLVDYYRSLVERSPGYSMEESDSATAERRSSGSAAG